MTPCSASAGGGGHHGGIDSCVPWPDSDSGCGAAAAPAAANATLECISAPSAGECSSLARSARITCAPCVGTLVTPGRIDGALHERGAGGGGNIDSFPFAPCAGCAFNAELFHAVLLLGVGRGRALAQREPPGGQVEEGSGPEGGPHGGAPGFQAFTRVCEFARERHA